MVDHPVDGRRSGHRVGEDVLPLREDQVGGYAHGATLVAFGDEREKHLGFLCTLGQVAQVVQEQGVKISMDGKGRYQDNIFVERLWRTVKYEEVYLKAYANVLEAQRGLEDYFRFYNGLRPHQALDYRTPARCSTGARVLL